MYTSMNPSTDTVLPTSGVCCRHAASVTSDWSIPSSLLLSRHVKGLVSYDITEIMQYKVLLRLKYWALIDLWFYFAFCVLQAGALLLQVFYILSSHTQPMDIDGVVGGKV